jgi:importin subunit alpha-6/7
MSSSSSSNRERQDRQPDRKADYKRTVDADDFRRRRDSTLSQLRKEKRDDSLQKRRQMSAALSGLSLGVPSAGNGDGDDDGASSALSASSAPVPAVPSLIGSAEEWTRVCGLLHSERADDVLAGMKELRVALTATDEAPPIDELLSRELVPRLAQCLLAADNLDLVFETAWVLTNVASCNGSAPYAVVAAGVLPQCVRLLHDPNTPEQIVDLVVWIIGNLAGEDSVLRNACLEESALSALMALLQRPDLSPALERSVAWVLSNLCRGAPTPDFAYIGTVLPTLATLLRSGDKTVVTDALWAFAHLLEHCDDAMRQAIVDVGVCSMLAKLLACPDAALVSPALRAIGGIVGGTTEQTDAMMMASPFVTLKRLLNSKSKRLLIDVCWVLSNFTAGTEDQIQAVIDVGVTERIVELMSGEVDFVVRREACWVLTNAVLGADFEQVIELVDEDCVIALINTAKCNDHRVQAMSLEALLRILEVGAEAEEEIGEDYFKECFEAAGGIEMMYELINSKDDKICYLVDKMLNHFEQEQF